MSKRFKFSQDLQRYTKLVRKAGKALVEQPFALAEELKDRWFFIQARPFMRLQVQRDHRLQIGENARIQSTDILRIVGNDARITIGKDVIMYNSCQIEAHQAGKIEIGDYCTFGSVRLYSRSHIRVGNYVLFSWGVHIQDHDPHPIDPQSRRQEIRKLHEDFVPRFSERKAENISLPERSEALPITIGDDVWIGANVTILKGVNIGSGSVIGAGSVVTRDIPPMSVAAGNPAKVIKQLPNP